MPKTALYTATKLAVTALTRSTRALLAETRIRTYAIGPFTTETVRAFCVHHHCALANITLRTRDCNLFHLEESIHNVPKPVTARRH